MIILEKGDRLFNEPNLEVYQSGEYQNDDLVLVNIIGEDIAKYQYVAYYVKYGTFEENENTE
jgi:hypothetical protein